MGEYAIRNTDGERIKIGTCEAMYYLRYEDRDKVTAEPGNVGVATDPSGLYFRLPFPDEDDQRPGEYQEYERGLRLYRRPEGEKWADFVDPSTADDPGIIQFHHQSGLLLNVPCYHGVKLPESGPGMKAFWNGKSWSLELAHVKAMPDGSVWPVIRCRHCRHMWRYEWANVWEYIEPAMQARLEKYIPVAVAPVAVA